MTRHLLLVDDDEAIRSVAGLGLERVGGYSVDRAASGVDALRMLRERIPDAILLDVMMPGVDGPTTLGRIRQVEGCGHVPVIFLTAKLQPAEVAWLETFDVVGVLGKPFDPMTLAEEVANMLGWEPPRGPGAQREPSR